MEAKVIINGVELTEAESMTLRCAIESFRTHMDEPFALGTDDHGIAMVWAYRRHAASISKLIHASQ